MKLLFITPSIATFGGVQRICLSRADYCAKFWGDEVHVISQNEPNAKPFFEVDASIQFHNVLFDKKLSLRASVKHYMQQLNELERQIQPDLILVSDNGLKAFLLPYFLKTKAKTVFECHGTLKIQEQDSENFIQKIRIKALQYFKKKSVRKYDVFLGLSQGSIDEWEIRDKAVIVPNFVGNTLGISSDLKNKILLSVARNSYEKGLDLLLEIWKGISAENPDWKWNIITSLEGYFNLKKMISEGNIPNVEIIPPQSDIEHYYQQASIYAMTSRFEGFPMVLLEAMSFGLPVISFRCPIGPELILRNDVNGILIENGNLPQYMTKLKELMNSNDLRKQFQQPALNFASGYTLEKSMGQFNDLVRSIK